MKADSQRAVVEELYRGFNDHENWCRECLTIPDKLGRIVPLVATPAQRKLFAAIRRQRELHRPVRIVYLKARQVHVSVGAASHLFHEVPFLPHQHALIVSHSVKSAQRIFGYVEHFQHCYRPYQGLIALPGVDTHQRRSGVAWANGSYIDILTAKNLEGGRSPSLRHLQLDEFAFWPDASRLMAGLLQAVPSDPETSILVISTANGIGGPFFDLWQRTSDRSRRSDWVPVFFAWWEHPEYALEPEDPAAFQRSLASKHPIYGDELAEQRKYSLTLAQLAWRRWCIEHNCSGSPELFRQEYPGSADEAFLASGRPRFQISLLSRMPQRAGITGELQVREVGLERRVVFGERDHGAVTLYRRPDPDGLYVIGADPAEGRDVREGTPGNTDPDYAVAQVLDAWTGEQVAKLRGRLEPAEFARQVHWLGALYGWAFLVPEVNGIGIATLQELLRLRYPVERIYRRRPEADVSGREGLIEHWGWKSTHTSREQLISALDAALLDESLILHDANTLQELRTFVIRPNGRAEHADECHDDEVIALALAVIGLRYVPRRKTQPAPARRLARYGRRRPEDDD